MRPAKFARFFLVMAGAAISAGAFAGTAAADHRDSARVLLVTSDSTLAAAAGIEVAKLSSQTFLRDFETAEHRDSGPEGLAGKLDPETAARLERLRRGE